jgi:hypothetical protein
MADFSQPFALMMGLRCPPDSAMGAPSLSKPVLSGRRRQAAEGGFPSFRPIEKGGFDNGQVRIAPGNPQPSRGPGDLSISPNGSGDLID